MTLDELRKVAEAATPGRWHIGHVNENNDSADIDAPDGEAIGCIYSRNNQSYACTFSPERVLKLLAVVEAAKEFKLWGEWKASAALDDALAALEET